jgi:hypothetical protein
MSLGVDQDLDVPACKVVVQGVIDEVGHEPTYEVGVSGCGGGLDRDVESQSLGGGSRFPGARHFERSRDEVQMMRSGPALTANRGYWSAGPGSMPGVAPRGLAAGLPRYPICKMTAAGEGSSQDG